MEVDSRNPLGAATGPENGMTLTSPTNCMGECNAIAAERMQRDKVMGPGKYFNSAGLDETDTSFGLKFTKPGLQFNSASVTSPSLKLENDLTTYGQRNTVDNVSDIMDDQDSDNDDEPVECGNCNLEFPTLQDYMDHECKGTSAADTHLHGCAVKVESNHISDNESELSDGESFDGKIVYNPDGSAYIIEGDSDLSELDSLLDLPEPNRLIIDKKGSFSSSTVPAFPQIANAFFVPRNPTSFFNSMYMLSPPKFAPEAPIMHSYRVYDVRSGKSKEISGDRNDDHSSDANSVAQSSTSSSQPEAVVSVPTKPILMCFICKLSFGYAKSFIAHATSEHSMKLNWEEKSIMSKKNASAIIQGVGKEKNPLMSFLEPNPPVLPLNRATGSKSPSDQCYVPNSVLCSSGVIKDTTVVSYVHAKPKVSDTITVKTASASSRSIQNQSCDDDTRGKSTPMGYNPNPCSGAESQSTGEGQDQPGSMASVSKRRPAESRNESIKLEPSQLDCRDALFNKIKTQAFEVATSEKNNNKETDVNLITSGSERNCSPAISDATSHMFSLSSTSPITFPGHPSTPFYGACDEHPQGRAQGVECPKCDMVLSSSQSLGGHMTMMHSRNSCKTLKCPKCNWHYKYQETLEIHMKEKHPENDTQCMYCMANQSHPRLARGESYSCGYKPYRCEVCNYSTTTKGNLSIHMQSDKHLNNVQEMANGGNPVSCPQEIKMPTQTYTVADNSQIKKNKPKPTWRCDVCNYETNVARNLRIHMTSEKHTHNMMVLQQNMKHMQRDMQIQQMNQMMLLQQDPSFMGLPAPMSGGITFPYDQNLLMAGMPGTFGEGPMDLTKENGGIGMAMDPQVVDAARLFQCCVCNLFATDSLEALHQHLQMDRTKHREQENIVVSNGTYMCNLCTYKTNLKANFQLHCKTDKHLQRLQLVNHIKEGGPNNEWRLKYLNVSNPVQVRCNACDYYTNSIHKLQIHTGNPRHESSAQLFHHLQVGETKIDAKLKFFHCTACDFSTKTKLNLIQHVRSMGHLRNESIHQIQLKEQGQRELDLDELFVVREYDGEGDGEDSSAALNPDGEVKEKKTDISGLPNSAGALNVTGSSNGSGSGNATSGGSGGITTSGGSSGITTSGGSSGNHSGGSSGINSSGGTSASLPVNTHSTANASGEHIHVCPYCNYSSVNEMRIQAHILTSHTQRSKDILCPLCQEEFKEKSRLEKHLVSVHNVAAEGLQRLLLMVDTGDWMMGPKNISQTPVIPQFPIDESGEINTEALEAEAAKLAEDAIDTAALPDKGDIDDQYRCQLCSKTFHNIDALYAHQNELGHLELKQTPRGPGYLCWKKGCNQYFKTAQALQIHFREIHAKRQNLTLAEHHTYKYRCTQCSLAFKNLDKLQLHSQYHLIWAATVCKLCTRSFRSVSALKKHVESAHSDLGQTEIEQYQASINANSMALVSLFGTSGIEKLISSSSTSTAASAAITNNNNNHQDESSAVPDLSSVNVKTEPNYEDGGESPGSNSEPMDTGSPKSAMSPSLCNDGADKLQNNNSQDSEMSESDDSGSYREQQFLEDYINSQAIAEGSYEDPNRKYKCHRCKVAFTKQNYLTAHNKTLQHRKGDKLSYPMEKYLDPNRPFKCDVCKESFTQKNILLVHYNSVSHLHKLKQVVQQGSVPSCSASPAPAVTTPIQNVVANSTSSSSPELDKSKPYRCNICRVAYSQGSTLDIHIRSVAHQTRASKLHELAVTGQVDLSLPLIEQPNDTQKTHQQQQKLLSEMLQQQSGIAMAQPSLIFQGLPPGLSGIPGLPQLPVLSGLPTVIPASSAQSSQAATTCQSTVSSSTSTTVVSTPSEITAPIPSQISLQKVQQAVMAIKKEPTEDKDASNQHLSDKSQTSSENQVINPAQSLSAVTFHTCQRCNAVFAAQESLIQHQMFCLFPITSAGSLPPLQQPPLLAQQQQAQQQQAQSQQRARYLSRFKQQVHRNLLENIGFECVMQFNEFNQPDPIKREEKDTDSGGEGKEEEMETETETETKIKSEKEDEVENEKDKLTDLPELNKSVCTSCDKEFSSVWVLKAHQEEVHRDMVPIGMVENFGQKFKSDFDKKQPKETEIVPSSPSNTSSVTNGENIINQEMPPPPPPPPQTPTHMDMAQMMPMFGMLPMQVPFSMTMAMNMHPPLMSMMLPMGMDSNMVSPINVVENNVVNTQKQLAQAAMQNQKRARTRINDEQLKVLRAHFDINNSPSEEQIMTMSEQSGLPTKVIKHWFRNTLFKERQRNKDSPYNFNNPPSTTLDWEEYEKTGKIPITADSPIMMEQYIKEEICEEKMEENDAKELPNNFDEKPQEKVRCETPPCPRPRPPSPELSDSRDSYSNLSTPSSMPSTPNLSHSLTPVSLANMDDLDGRLSPHSASKRANRTRFTDYQIKLLQEYFDKNAYPKDDELDHLSKLLSLSPRVIVVWFQNARQKARKMYENQPPTDLKDSPGSQFQRTAGLNYQCKKCNAVFPRYYDLIKHQKRQCMADPAGKPPPSSIMGEDEDSNSSFLSDHSDRDSLNSSDLQLSYSKEDNDETARYKCEKCHLVFHKLDRWQEHQTIHTLSPGLFGGFGSGSAFDVLQNMAAAQAQQQQQKQQLDANSPLKRKSEEEKDDDRDDQPRDKRLRTTILPEQLDYLYQKYQLDCNPSRKQLETISQDVGLKKRVVQVWFQNTRARERKGQYRAHQQLIHKRCPFCRALFRAKSALESHLATKHPEEMAKGDVNIDAIPDAAMEPGSANQSSSVLSPNSSNSDISKLLSPPGMQSFLPLLPQASMGFSPMADPIQLSMKQFYEDSFKKYIHELSATSHNQKLPTPETPSTSKRFESTTTKINHQDSNDVPLDLSKPLKVNIDTDKYSEGPLTDMSERSFDDQGFSTRRFSLEDSYSETHSEFHENDMNEESSNVGSSRGSSPVNQMHSTPSAGKRYRTQMTSLQVRMMKRIFGDYKTPTMAECEMLGREIGLPKRVVQVWFQNARAKEKKAKLAMAKTFGPDVDYTKPPDECKLCKFKYSHKYTIQDHLFTKKHIEKVKNYIQSQSEAEREMSDPTGMSQVLRQQREMDRMQKAWDEASQSQSHLAHLQAIGMNSMGFPVGGLGGSFNPTDMFPEMSIKKERHEEKEAHKKNSGVTVKKEPITSEPSQIAIHLMSPFGGFMPGLDPGLLSYMHPGLPGYFPGIPGVPLPGIMPGAEHLLPYDPMTFGTPLPLLQIPHQAIKDVSSKLSDPKASVGQYTQDCKSISSLKSLVKSTDYNCAREATADVGYICKKCQMVYPAKDACVTHQRTMCFAGGKIPEGIQPILKLEQIQYECKVCTDKLSTVQEYKGHCHQESHKIKVAKLLNRSSSSSSVRSSSSSHSSIAQASNTAGSGHMEHSSPKKTFTPSKISSSSMEVLNLAEKVKATIIKSENVTMVTDKLKSGGPDLVNVKKE